MFVILQKSPQRYYFFFEYASARVHYSSKEFILALNLKKIFFMYETLNYFLYLCAVFCRIMGI